MRRAWTETLGWPALAAGRAPLVGVMPGEGIGPEVVGAALRVLDAVEGGRGRVERVVCPAGMAGAEGVMSELGEGFCREIFEAGGVLFCGAYGGRFVYDLRRRFDLFCKLVPIRPAPALLNYTRFKPASVAGVDILIVRENAGGLYQGSWGTRDAEGSRTAWQSFSYSQADIERITRVGATLARERRGEMQVVVKDGGVPAISELWKETARATAKEAGVRVSFLNVDYAAYRLIQEPQTLDLVVTPNMIGDVLADLAAGFLGSRGVSFSGNFGGNGRAAYQTGHGAAADLAGTGRANPAGQILSLAMLLRESVGAAWEAGIIEQALDRAWAEGCRTEDLAGGGTCVTTEAMGARVAEIAAALVAEARGSAVAIGHGGGVGERVG